MKKRIVKKKQVKKAGKKEKAHSAKKAAGESRIPTYIGNFDNLIEGGFEKNSTNLVVGSSGSGKTIFAMQFLVGGMKKGEKCLYVTFEEKKDEFFSNMKKFGWDLEDYEKKGLFTFLEYAPLKVKTMLEEGGGEIESLILRKKITRMIIDSITSFGLLFNDELEKREAALSLFNMISEWDCTSLLTFEGEPLDEQETASKTMEFESDSIILIHYIRNKGKRERYIEVLKMRGTLHSNQVYKFEIGKTGILIDKRPCKNPPKF